MNSYSSANATSSDNTATIDFKRQLNSDQDYANQNEKKKRKKYKCCVL